MAYSHFRYDMDHDNDVLYCYEIQTEQKMRRKGLGKFMMKVLELLMIKSDLLKIMLTVFKHNESASKFFKDVLKYEIDEPACICSVFRPEDFTEGNYRCVTPGDLIKPLRAAKQILSKGIFWWKTIQLGMDENFYIRIRGSVYKEFAFQIKSEPDVVKYEDEEPDSDDDDS